MEGGGSACPDAICVRGTSAQHECVYGCARVQRANKAMCVCVDGLAEVPSEHPICGGCGGTRTSPADKTAGTCTLDVQTLLLVPCVSGEVSLCAPDIGHLCVVAMKQLV